MSLWRAEVKRKSVFALVSDVPKQAFSMFFSETMHVKQDLLSQPDLWSCKCKFFSVYFSVYLKK